MPFNKKCFGLSKEGFEEAGRCDIQVDKDADSGAIQLYCLCPGQISEQGKELLLCIPALHTGPGTSAMPHFAPSSDIFLPSPATVHTVLHCTALHSACFPAVCTRPVTRPQGSSMECSDDYFPVNHPLHFS